MGRFVKAMNGFFQTLPDHLRKRKWMVLIVFVFITVFLSAGLGKIVVDESLDAYFQEDDPAKLIYDDFKVRFGGDESVYIVYKAKDGDIFSERSLKTLKDIHDDLMGYRNELEPGETSPLDHILDVKSLINVKYMEADSESLYSKNFIGDTLPTTDTQREKLREKAVNHPDYPMLYLSKTSEYGGIVIRTDFNARIHYGKDEGLEGSNGAQIIEHEFSEENIEDDIFAGENEYIEDSGSVEPGQARIKKTGLTEYAPFINAVKQIINKPGYSEDLEFHPVGNPVIMDFFSTVIVEDMGKVTGMVLVLIVIMLLVLFRSFSAVVWSVLIIVLTLVWTMGIIGWSGVPATTMVTIIVFLVLAIGVADSVHILSGYLFFRNANFFLTDASAW